MFEIKHHDDTFEVKNDNKTPADFNSKMKEFSNAIPQPANPLNKPEQLQPVTMSQNLEPEQLTGNRKSGKKMILIAASAFVFLILTGSAYYFLTKKVSAEELVKLTVAKIIDSKSYHFDGSIDLTSQGQTVSLKAIGDFDQTDLKNTNASSFIDMTLGSLLFNLNPKIKYKKIGPDNYFKIKIENLPMLGEQFASFNDQWIKYDAESLKELVPSSNLNNNSLNPEKTLDIKNLIKETKFFANIKELGTEKINNTDTRHISFELDKTATRTFILKVQSIITEKELTADQQKAYDENLNKTETIKGDIWIGAKDYYLYKLILPITSNDQGEKSTFNLQVQFSNFDQPITVATPENFKTMSEIAKLIAKQQTKYYANSENYNSTDTDGDNLADQLEIIIGTNPNNKDSDGDGFNDYDEIINGFNPLNASKGAKFIIPNLTSSQKALFDDKTINDVRQLSTIIDVEDAATPNSIITGCTSSYALINSCLGPGDISQLKKFNYLFNPTIACNKNSQTSCNYSISRANGSAGAKTDDYQICFYLEKAISNINPALKVGINSISAGGILKQGCN